MKKELIWATASEYEQVFAHLTQENVPTDNVYDYVELLTKEGLTVNPKNVKQWLESKSRLLNIKGFKLK